jgi:hypothetical protein
VLFVGAHEVALLLLKFALQFSLAGLVLFKHSLVVLELLFEQSLVLLILGVVGHLSALNLFATRLGFCHFLGSCYELTIEFLFLFVESLLRFNFSTLFILLNYLELFACRLHVSVHLSPLNFSGAEFAFDSLHFLALLVLQLE